MLRLWFDKVYRLCASLTCPGGIGYRLALRVPSLVDGVIADEFTDVLGTGVSGCGKRVHLTIRIGRWSVGYVLCNTDYSCCYTWLRTEKVLVWRAVLLGRMNSDDREGWHLSEFGLLVFCKNCRNKLDFLSKFEKKLLAGGSFWLDGFQRQKGRMCLSGCLSIGKSVRNARFFRWNPTTE